MGTIFSKPPAPAVKPRDAKRVKAASQALEAQSGLVDKLKALAASESFQGTLLLAPTSEDDLLGGTPEADAYHQQRERPFYFNDCNYPAAILLPKSVQDVVEIMKQIPSILLKDSSLTFCIASGCHSHHCMMDTAIVLDLEHLKEVTVNLESKTVTVQGGAKICQVHAALKEGAPGWSFMTGTNGDTGVSGLTLAGGVGYLGGQAGFACDTVISAQVVLTSGELVTATDTNEYKDLLRGLRGGGGNFGVVVEWTFQLFDVSNAFGGTVVHFAPTLARVKTVLRNYAKIIEDMPDAGSSIIAMPGGAPVFINVATMIGNEVKDAKVYREIPFLASISDLGALFRISNDLGRKDYIDEIAAILEPVQQRCYASAIGAMVYAFDEALQDALVHFTRVDLPSGKNTKPIIIVQSISGEMRRNDGSKSSIRHRKAVAWVIIEAGYEPHATPEQIQSVRDWATRAKKKVMDIGGEDGPHNFCDSDGRPIKFFTDEQRVFLEGAKKKYDPNNLLTLPDKTVVSYSE